MTKRTLESLKAAFGSSDKPEGGQQFTNNYYPFWNMKTGQRAVVRFLPDADSTNPRGFLVEKVFHNLMINGQKKTVPCLSMYGEECPICKVSQAYYKAKDDANGKKYWRKTQYVAQALVVEDPLPADAESGETHAGKVRYFALGYQIYNIIKEAFAAEDDPLEGIPYDCQDGYDFIIKKSEKGGYADYSVGTKFFSKQRSLSEDEMVVVDEGMIELTTLLPKNPGVEKVQAMLDADLSGGDYQDGSKSASGKKDDEDEEFAPTQKAAAPAPKPAAKEPAAEKASSDDESGGSEVDDMLAAIRSRRAAKQ